MAFTEMVSTKGLLFESKNTVMLLNTDFSNGAPGSSRPTTNRASRPAPHALTAAQIFGSDPYEMRKVCESRELQKFPLIDINMGCPVKKIFNNNEGCALMGDIPLASKIVSECAESGKLISVKFRLGLDKNKIIAEDFAKMCEQSGAAMITLHARTRDDNASAPDYNEIEKVKNAVKIPVIGNGGIYNAADAERMLETGCDGIMLARGVLFNPFLINEVLKTNPPMTLYEFITEQVRMLKTVHDDKYVAVNFRKCIANYLRGKKDNKIIKEKIMKLENTDEMLDILKEYFLSSNNK